MSGLSLWLCPPSGSALKPLVSRLAAAHGTVQFDPHATLVSDEIVPSLSVPDVVQRVEEGVAAWRAQGSDELELRYKDVRQGDRFYQCVLAALVPSRPLLDLHESLLRSFSLPVPSPPTYFPHVSLVYGDLPTSLKSSIVSSLEAEGEVRPAQRGEGVEIGGESSFRPAEVLLVRTSGPTSEWEVLAKLPLRA